MDDAKIISELEKELSKQEKEKKAIDYEAAVEQRKKNLKGRIKSVKKYIKKDRKKKAKEKKQQDKKEEEEEKERAAIIAGRPTIAPARFIVEYTTNLTGNRKFVLKNENIQNEIEKIQKRKKTLLNKGDKVIYLDPNDKDRYGMTAKIIKLNFETKKLSGRPVKLTQFPRQEVKMGVYRPISAAPAASYDIKFLKSNSLSKNKRILKNVSTKYVYHDKSLIGIWTMGFIPGGSTKKTDNTIRKIINKLLAKGTIFIPSAIYNKKTNNFNQPKKGQQYKIRDSIINVQQGNKLFKSNQGSNQIMISVNLFLQETRTPGGKAIPFSMKKVKNNIDMSCSYHLSALKNIGKRIVGGSRNAKGGGFTGVWIVRKNKPSIRKFINDHLTQELVNNTQEGVDLLEDLKLIIDNNDVDDDEYIYIERHEEMVAIEGKPLEYIFSWDCCPDRQGAGMLCDELEDEEWQQCKWIEINESRPNLNTSAQRGGRKKTRKKRKKRNRKTRKK